MALYSDLNYVKPSLNPEYLIYDDKIKMNIKDGGRLNVIINI